MPLDWGRGGWAGGGKLWGASDGWSGINGVKKGPDSQSLGPAAAVLAAGGPIPSLA